jgi:hypothetical protein
MRFVKLAIVVFVSVAPVWPQAGQLKTADAVLDRYKHALGGADPIAAVRSLTVHGEFAGTGMNGKASFIYYAKPFKTLMKVTRDDGSQVTSGFDGSVSWTIDSQGATVDRDTALEAVRRDADLQYPLHQRDYFKTLDLAGVTDFEGGRCYWLHGTTHWGKDNNQFYDVETGLLAGYRFQSDDKSAGVTVALFQDYKNFGGPLMATNLTFRTGDRLRTFHYNSVAYEPLADSLFELPPAIKALLK